MIAVAVVLFVVLLLGSILYLKMHDGPAAFLLAFLLGLLVCVILIFTQLGTKEEIQTDTSIEVSNIIVSGNEVFVDYVRDNDRYVYDGVLCLVTNRRSFVRDCIEVSKNWHILPTESRRFVFLSIEDINKFTNDERND